ncbi:MAG: hypothetical protein JSS02_21945 [Planctomycetes bacterium]|nr:hypothetical protein [Planctomycetota bacterium]
MPISMATVDREWACARTWLFRELQDQDVVKMSPTVCGGSATLVARFENSIRFPGVCPMTDSSP